MIKTKIGAAAIGVFLAASALLQGVAGAQDAEAFDSAVDTTQSFVTGTAVPRLVTLTVAVGLAMCVIYWVKKGIKAARP